MTPIEAMENVATRIRDAVKEYKTHQRQGTFPVSVYAGYPPFSTKPEQRESYIYCYRSRCMTPKIATVGWISRSVSPFSMRIRKKAAFLCTI